MTKAALIKTLTAYVTETPGDAGGESGLVFIVCLQE